ncbi:hypothetical protein CDCA_CDCA16G4240 [Cyanidium caldarium]|uniref:Uncharacterized protein n=1 Tax=Cyanidium caldarium TaxID=2771 RepID=A0AAV9J1L7_CYACA|nr:hypothetical protein CDCA_CDCA16G4240 [Cyanidium caldarium]|eukprot:ctg_497.g159
MGLEPLVIPSHFDESLLDAGAFASPAAYAQESARCKAMDVAQRMQRDARPFDYVVGSDTVVVLEGGRVLEKPADEGAAFEMLSLLSGATHTVVTGVAVYVSGSGELRTFYEETRVRFAELSKEEIWAYIRTGEPMDKAGAYGIQGLGGMLVQRLEGDFFCVMGFPMHRFAAIVAEMID